MHKYIGFAHPATMAPAGEDLCVVLDRSPSMDVDDFVPSRLAGAKQAFRELLAVKRETYPYDRVGVVAFDADAEIVCPLTSVQTGSRIHEQKVNDLETEACTNITAGLKKAELVLASESSEVSRAMRKSIAWISKTLFETPKPPSPGKNRTRRILLLGDGAHNHGPEPDAVSNRLKKNGIVIDVIGISGDRTSRLQFDEEQLKGIASRNPDGSARYCFISDSADLIKTFGNLAHHIRPLMAQS